MSKDYQIEKEWKSNGLKCMVLLVHNGSHRCGYVGVPKNNPAYDLSYDDVPVSVHGGLTFSSRKIIGRESSIYWLGFDCAHFMDETRMEGISKHKGEHFWELDEVIEETEDLAKQLSEITWKQIVEHKLEYMPDWFKNRVKIIDDVR